MGKIPTKNEVLPRGLVFIPHVHDISEN